MQYRYIILFVTFSFLLTLFLQTSGSIRAFSSPANAIVKVLFQTAGEVEFETLFNDGDLLYSTMAYILFIVFVILMPLLFQAMLVSSSNV